MDAVAVFPQDLRRRVEDGSALLAPVLAAAGFTGPAIEAARGSGGPAAIALWQRADGMSVETHVRGSLGIVRYCWADAAVTHQHYLRLRGRQGAYPGYGHSAGDAFAHLRSDLEGVAADVLMLSAKEFETVAAAIASLPKPRLP
jgi:hypothetical protein